jgi:tetratricopeptide (TPR) repeat protein
MRLMTMIVMILSAGCATAPNAQQFNSNGMSDEARAYNHYLAGVLYQRNGKSEEAAEEYRKASDLLPESTLLNVRLVQFYIDMQDFENAEIMCRRVLERVPNDASLWIILAQLHQQQDKHEQAAEALEKAMSLKPESLEDFEGLLRVGELSNDRITTIDVLNQLTELIPDSSGLYLQLGMTLARINNGTDAQAALEKALELDPALVQARSLLGIVYLEDDKNEAAIEQLRLYLDKMPEEDRSREFLAGALARTGAYEDAVSEIATIVEQGHPEPVQYLEQIYLLVRAGRTADALAVVPANDTPILGTVFRAIARKAAGEPYRPLLESLDEVEGDLDFECSEYLNGILYLFGKDNAGVFLVDAFTSMRGEYPQSRSLDLIQARALMSMERDAEAAEILEATLTRSDDAKLIHFYLGTVYESLERYRESDRHLRRCLELDPSDAETMNNLGYMYAEQGIKLDEAERLLKKALELSPENGFYLDSLGWIYYKKGKADLAIEYIRRAILAMERDDAILRDHLGDAYLLNGETGKAVREWERARRLDPELEGVQEKIDAQRKTIEI